MTLLFKEPSMRGKKSNSGQWLLVFLRAITFLFLLTGTQYGAAQVSNNTINERLRLKQDAEPINSTTAQSTVEWECVNKKLTQRCLIYHNDQWFSFTASTSGRLFLNIADQVCAKKYGVQVVVIEGNPCMTSSYKLRHCQSFTNQNDTYIELDSLQAGQLYLINIDGFLADVCDFTIQLSTKPLGIPISEYVSEKQKSSISCVQNVVSVSWQVESPRLDSLDFFELYRQRRGAFKNEKIGQMGLRHNALGKATTTYTYIDTLSSYGLYEYTIIGVFNKEMKREVVGKESIEFLEVLKENSRRRHIASVYLHGRKKEDIDFLILNAATSEVIMKEYCTACSNQRIDFDLTKYVNQGIEKFWIESFQTKTRQQKQYIFYIDKVGNLVEK